MQHDFAGYERVAALLLLSELCASIKVKRDRGGVITRTSVDDAPGFGRGVAGVRRVGLDEQQGAPRVPPARGRDCGSDATPVEP